MFKRLINHAELRVALELDGPMLVKSGKPTVTGLDMAFIQSFKNGIWQPVLPGSSLKGVLRSHAERFCRSLKEHSVCVPYQRPGTKGACADDDSCGFRLDEIKKARERQENRVGSAEVYRVSCPICRLFGSTHYAGRLSTRDAWLKEPAKAKLEPRDGVAIDRFTGGAAPKLKFDMEVLAEGVFEVLLEVENFEAQQLGLLATALMDLCDGHIRIGAGTSRGLGKVKATIESFVLSYYQAKAPEKFQGLGAVLSAEERRDYGIEAERPGPVLKGFTRRGLRWSVDIAAEWEKVLAGAGGEFQQKQMEQTWPRAMNALEAAR